ncbi:MAG: M1 family metallopeptidase [bacterium]
MTRETPTFLPDDMYPRSYRITLAPDLLARSFQGEEEVQLEIVRRTNRIVLHAADLEIESAACSQAGRVHKPSRIVLDPERETATFELPDQLQEGPASLHIRFSGAMNDQMRGFYRSETVLDGRKRPLAVTQFEATDARRAFPCWDEPARKARFELTLIVPSDRTALSNMPVSEAKDRGDGTTRVRFAETPIMSTYLLAFIVGDFDRVEGETREGIGVSVYTPPGKKEQGRFALDVAVRSLSFFHDYFGVAYPLPKMDLIAVPDFAAGAMENWGAVTYRETAILVDPDNSSAQTRQRVAMVVAHELAHQWFGNLVTMAWWTHLWLNEGFATYLQYLAVDRLFPEWEVWTQFVASEHGRALRLDGLSESHPIEVEVRDPSEISEIFDAISYSKGAAVIRMLAAQLGTEALRKGLQIYLTRHAYGNATTEDLWSDLGEASGVPVKAIMDTWTKQTGYPVVSLEQRGRGREACLRLRQARFLLAGIRQEGPDEALWWIPVSLRSGRSGSVAFRPLNRRHSDLGVELGPGDWIKINDRQAGFYRVDYPEELWQQLRPVVQSRTLSAADRLGLQSDALALARAGLCPTTAFLDLVGAYRDETDYTVWSDLSSNMSELGLLLCQEACYDDFLALARSLYRSASDRLGWQPRPDENHLDSLLRGLLLEQLGQSRDGQTIAQACDRFLAFWNEGLDLAPDLRLPIYRMVVETGGAQEYEKVLTLFRRTDLNEEKVRCLRALGCTQDPELIRRTLAFALSAEVKPQDAVFPIASVASNPGGMEAAWHFLMDRWSELLERYGNGGFMLARLVAATTQNFVTVDKAEEIRSFFQTHPAPAADRTVRQSIERVRSNHLWLERERSAVQRWLAGRRACSRAETPAAG